MKQLFQWIMAALVLGWEAGLAVAADPPPMLAAPPPMSAPTVPAMPVMTEPVPMNFSISSDNNRGGIIAGAGVYFLQPKFSSNPAFFLETFQPGGRFTLSTVDFEYDTSASPLVWLGYVADSGLGGRVRWWRFDQSANESIVVGPNTFVEAAVFGFFGIGAGGPGDQVAFTSNLKIDIWDAEALDVFRAGNWDLLLSGGVRYAHIAQHYNAFLSSTFFGGFTETILSGNSFDGAGPTVALEARRRLGDTNLGVYANGRASLLFGTSHQVAFERTNIAGATPFDFEQSEKDLRPITEVEVGGLYDLPMRRADLFVQAGLVGQVWFDGGSASGGTAFFFGAKSGDDFGFIGAVLRAGLRY